MLQLLKDGTFRKRLQRKEKIKIKIRRVIDIQFNLVNLVVREETLEEEEVEVTVVKEDQRDTMIEVREMVETTREDQDLMIKR